MTLAKWRSQASPNILYTILSHLGSPEQTLSPKHLVVASKACSSCKDLKTARRIHLDAILSGLHLNIFVATSLLDMFAKCGSMVEAYTIFNKLPHHNAASYTALMLGNVENGFNEQALDLLPGVLLPDALAFVAALVACSNLATKEQSRRIQGTNHLIKLTNLERGMSIHSQLRLLNFESTISVANTLVSMYCKCGSLVDARVVFDRVAYSSPVAWNSLILGYTDNGEPELALEFFRYMPQVCTPDARSFVAALTACTSMAAKEDGELLKGKVVKTRSLELGMDVHSQALESGYGSHVYLASTLVNLYARCGSLGDARRVFEGMQCRDLVSWTALLLGYAESGEGDVALQLFTRMQEEGFEPDARAYVAALKACSDKASREDGVVISGKTLRLESLERGFMLHSGARKLGFESNIFVATSLVDLYSQCGSLLDARVVFDRMGFHNLVSWNALILGYAINGEPEISLELFFRLEEPERDVRAFVAGLVACASLVAVEPGKAIQANIYRRGCETNLFLANALVDFYCKCGSMVNARVLFDSIASSRSLISWSTLISGYGRQGDARSVLELFGRLQEEGLKPDKVTYLSILTACSHAGLVDRGREIFDEMLKAGVRPGIEHYDCVIDLLGRGNYLKEGVKMAKEMAFEAKLVTWNSLLGACKKWKNVEIGEVVFEEAVKLDVKQASTYLTMAGLYASVGMFQEQTKVLELKKRFKAFD